MHSYLILLNGTIVNDSRVIRQANACAELGRTSVLSVENGERNRPCNLSGDIKWQFVTYPDSLRQKIYKHSHIHREFDFLASHILKQGISFDVVIANDLPCLKSAILLKQSGFAEKVLYDSHEIYLETVKQFFPGRSEMSFIKRSFANALTRLMIRSGRRFERAAAKDCDGIITVNQSLADYFTEVYQVDTPFVVRSIPDIGPVKPVDEFDFRARYGLKRDDVILLYQGVINPGRGLFLLVEALSKLPENYKLVILGDGPLKNQVELYSRKQGVSDRVYLFGQVTNAELSRYTAGADLGICLIEPINKSKRLALPNKIFEYLHSGIPVLGSDIPEVKSLIDEYNVGTVVKLEAVEIADAIKNMDFRSYDSNIAYAGTVLNWEKEKQVLKEILQCV